MALKYFVSYQNNDTGDLANVEIDREEPFFDISDIRELEADIAANVETESVVVIHWRLFGEGYESER